MSRLSIRGFLAPLVLALALAIQAAPAAADGQGTTGGDDMGSEAGLGVASALCTLLYGPVKIVYAGLGSLVGGAAWLLTGGDTDVSSPVFTASVRGDYVVTPDHLTGRRTLEFVGRPPAERSAPVANGSYSGANEGY
jgi:hypothetical protein